MRKDSKGDWKKEREDSIKASAFTGGVVPFNRDLGDGPGRGLHRKRCVTKGNPLSRGQLVFLTSQESPGPSATGVKFGPGSWLPSFTPAVLNFVPEEKEKVSLN